ARLERWEGLVANVDVRQGRNSNEVRIRVLRIRVELGVAALVAKNTAAERRPERRTAVEQDLVSDRLVVVPAGSQSHADSAEAVQETSVRSAHPRDTKAQIRSLIQGSSRSGYPFRFRLFLR